MLLGSMTCEFFLGFSSVFYMTESDISISKSGENFWQLFSSKTQRKITKKEITYAKYSMRESVVAWFFFHPFLWDTLETVKGVDTLSVPSQFAMVKITIIPLSSHRLNRSCHMSISSMSSSWPLNSVSMSYFDAIVPTKFVVQQKAYRRNIFKLFWGIQTL